MPWYNPSLQNLVLHTRASDPWLWNLGVTWPPEMERKIVKRIRILHGLVSTCCLLGELYGKSNAKHQAFWGVWTQSPGREQGVFTAGVTEP